MSRRTASRIALASAVMLAVGGALATPAMADGGQVGHEQYFYGEFFGLTGVTTPDVIQMSCTNASLTGHPLADQYVAAHEVLPPIAPTYGYTGNSGTEIDVTLTYTLGGVIATTGTFATLTYYDTEAEIPTSLTLPCSGSGDLVYTPSPDADGTGVATQLAVTFAS
jgi:hypothetical protein